MALRQVSEIPKVDHREAMELAETAYGRFLDLVRTFTKEDWSRPTDCAHLATYEQADEVTALILKHLLDQKG